MDSTGGLAPGPSERREMIYAHTYLRDTHLSCTWYLLFLSCKLTPLYGDDFVGDGRIGRLSWMVLWSPGMNEAIAKCSKKYSY